MKQAMLDAVSYVTPFLLPLGYVGGVLLLIGGLGLVIWIFKGWGTRLLRFSGRLLLVLGAFFLICQVLWMVVGLEPRITEEASLLEFKSRPFWMVGLAFLLPGFAMRIIGSMRPTY
ncbi:transporter, putative [Rhodomicrobium vannielii ATCC 17100]|uniref:Transporter, putative n=1 Tax=Rhodomicrobium vannielii (strain ATCC 17100 / DSM 162 / LMG 4299 / NCIMB 10020 / ATH 3.1.1) TaxID=648757 RepID=E3HZB7_RHOVT|nr:hypothetical protein [Rhodomicrobium vannielii]ADP69863.1 transporter, putative [Rhodomicrobium vannielii ATCC 17100]